MGDIHKSNKYATSINNNELNENRMLNFKVHTD